MTGYTLRVIFVYMEHEIASVTIRVYPATRKLLLSLLAALKRTNRRAVVADVVAEMAEAKGKK